ncbi:lymphocyte antigen 6D-like [Nerophis ophidion]|uniref:lymphocyte antigen 6D-like n=1 Tax=Nerophis ophidion TaxID=159077 RepID=UPI002AE09155|nr:lymphocyte antigen 6D-like [Nerophis ophidion]
MKIVVLALLVVLVVSQGEALRCNCGGRRQCPGNVETCSGEANACASVIFHVPCPGYFKGCMKMTNCKIMNQPGITTTACCSSDLCN